MSPRLRSFAFACALFAGLASARAVVVAGGDGTQNTTAPANDFGFANVGRVFDGNFFGSGVYLGDGWMLSAYHLVANDALTGFDFGPVLLAGQTFSVDAASAVRLTTPGASFSDLALFRLTELPVLPSLVLSSTAFTAGTSITLAGNGYDRQATETHWTSTWNEVPAHVPGGADGYKLTFSQSIRWGTNSVMAFSGGSATQVIDYGLGSTTLAHADFSSGITNEAMVAPGDSGGGVFTQQNGHWELAGLLLTATNQADPQLRAVAYGDESYFADLSVYRQQIAGIVPEPGTGALLGFGAFALGLRRRKR